jgi:low temperature requirement protein LtrA
VAEAGTDQDTDQDDGKRVSWVELYFDLIFVFAISQAAHTIVARPSWSGLGVAFGVFITLWWTWIGFAVLCNRHGDDRARLRLFMLAGTLPCAIAAVELQSAPAGDTAGYTLALAAARLVLALAYPVAGEGRIARRAGIGYAVSTVLFVVIAFVPGPGRYAILAVALAQEAAFLLTGSSRRTEIQRRRAGRVIGERRSRTDALKAAMQAPENPEDRVDASHLAERFGLFMIILLGEIVVSVGSGALGVPEKSVAFWAGLLGGLVLAAALWWIYFDSAAHINEYVLRASGGNPAMAYGIYAGGHLGPAFALLAIAAGVNLTLHGHPPTAASWLVAGGLAAYLVGTRAFRNTQETLFGRLLRAFATAATVCIGLLQHVISPSAVLAVIAVWAVGAAALVSLRKPRLLSQLASNPLSLFHSG